MFSIPGLFLHASRLKINNHVKNVYGETFELDRHNARGATIGAVFGVLGYLIVMFIPEDVPVIYTLFYVLIIMNTLCEVIEMVGDKLVHSTLDKMK